MIPIETFSALENRVQNLQVAILVAASKSLEPITVGVIRHAIRQSVESLSNQCTVPQTGPRTIRVPERDAYDFLERRLDNLRGFVLRMAEDVSRDAELPEVTPGIIQTCWMNVFAKPSLVKSILDSDSTMADPVEEQSSDPELVMATSIQNP